MLFHTIPDESEYDQDEERGSQDDLGPLIQPVPPPPPAEVLPVEVEEAAGSTHAHEVYQETALRHLLPSQVVTVD